MQKQPKTIRVRPVGNALVMDLDAMEAGIKRMVGRKPVKQEGEMVVHGDPLYNTLGVDWVSTGQTVTLKYRHEYRQAVQQGDLEVMDEESAKMCGVWFWEP